MPSKHFDTLKEALGPTRQAAVRLLARREYGAVELIESLCHKGFPEEAVSIVVNRLQEKDLQSDERFVEVFVRSRKSRGQGPVRIRAELQQRVISEELINRYVAGDEQDWVALACQVYQKRFGKKKAVGREDQVRQQRYLYYKGFTFDQINVALAQTDG